MRTMLAVAVTPTREFGDLHENSYHMLFLAFAYARALYYYTVAILTVIGNGSFEIHTAPSLAKACDKAILQL